MKKKILFTTLITLVAILALTLTGCGNTSSTEKEYTQYESIAFAAVDVVQSAVDYSTTTENLHGNNVVEFSVNGVKYTVTIDSTNNVLSVKINEHEVSVDNVPNYPDNDSKTNYITEAQAEEIALQDAGVTETIVPETKLDFDDGQYLYDVEFTYNNKKYEYEIVATTGAIFEKDVENVTVKERKIENKTFIGIDSAKTIALTDASVANENATFTEAKIDYDHGVYVYEIEFYANSIEYEYEINAETGNIIDSENSATKHQNTNPGSTEGFENAKQKALAHAGLDINSVRDFEIELDVERGVKVYEIDFKYGQYEYEYVINAEDNTIISFEKELDD